MPQTTFFWNRSCLVWSCDLHWYTYDHLAGHPWGRQALKELSDKHQGEDRCPFVSPLYPHYMSAANPPSAHQWPNFSWCIRLPYLDTSQVQSRCCHVLCELFPDDLAWDTLTEIHLIWNGNRDCAKYICVSNIIIFFVFLLSFTHTYIYMWEHM